jgi:hypothetical protein
VKAAAAKQAAKERGSEKRFSASRTFPICQTGCQKEVTDKGKSKKKARDNKGEPDFEHRTKEKPKHHEPEPSVRAPGGCVVGINPESVRLVRAVLQTF